MKNFFEPIKVEKYKYITVVWCPQLETVARMCKEHYDIKEYDDTVIFVGTYYSEKLDCWLNPDDFTQSRKIYYNLEHKYWYTYNLGCNDNFIVWLHLMNIDEVWTIEPGIELLEKEFPTKYMPMRYVDLPKIFNNPNNRLIDIGFVGIINMWSNQHRAEFFDRFTSDCRIDFSIKILNGDTINTFNSELSNCKFILDMKREWAQEYQNQVRIFEHICLGHTILSEKCQNNIFPGLIYEWNTIEDLNKQIHTLEPEDFSDKYKAMTYRDEDYENYRNKMIKTY